MLLQYSNRGNFRGEVSPGGKPRQGGKGFSVVELLLAIVIMGVITFALYAVFNQTQRALRASETQSDVSERGRAIMEMLSREFEQGIPTLGYTLLNPTNKSKIDDFGVNMESRLEFEPSIYYDDRNPPIVSPRTNFIYNLLLFNKPTNAWNVIGYKVVGTNGVGTLFRYGAVTNTKLPSPQLREDFYTTLTSLNEYNPTFGNFHYIANGVMHFNITAYDQNGLRLGYDTTNKYPGYTIMRARFNGQPYKPVPTYSNDTDSPTNATVILKQAHPDPKWTRETGFTFRSNALPAYLEIELGLLEPETFKQYQLMLEDGNPNAAGFLTNKINKVHLFRQRIPIRTAVQ